MDVDILLGLVEPDLDPDLVTLVEFELLDSADRRPVLQGDHHEPRLGRGRRGPGRHGRLGRRLGAAIVIIPAAERDEEPDGDSRQHHQ
jgi:hypothetical protein